MFGLHPRTEKGADAKTRLAATVVEVEMRPTGEVLTLDNEQVWQVTEYRREPVVDAHDAVIIVPASLGAFLMTRASGGSAVYVKRLR